MFRLITPILFVRAACNCAGESGTCNIPLEATADEESSLLSLHGRKHTGINKPALSSPGSGLEALARSGKTIPAEVQREILSEHGHKFGEDWNAACTPPPIFQIRASSLYDAGRQHGVIARERIHGWFNSSGMKEIFTWVGLMMPDNASNATGVRIGDDVHNSYNGPIVESKPGEGKPIFDKLKSDNAKEFPEYADEIQGIADGAGIPPDFVWAANLLIELDFLRAQKSQSPAAMFKAGDHCSDLYAIAPGGYRHGFAHGHNEDETETIKDYYYFLSYTFTDVPSKVNPSYKRLTNCAGLTYPGTMFGISGVWNEFGMWSTQNTMHLRETRSDGLAAIMIQRRAICEARNMDEAIKFLSVPGWNGGVSMNLVDVRGQRMANVETFENMSHALEVTEKMGNFSHFNQYKHLNEYAGWEIDNPYPFLKIDRQGAVDQLPPMHSADDIMTRLSLAELFRPNSGFPDRATIAQLVLNGTAGEIMIWTCGRSAVNHPRDPTYKWSIFNFFNEDASTLENHTHAKTKYTPTSGNHTHPKPKYAPTLENHTHVKPKYTSTLGNHTQTKPKYVPTSGNHTNAKPKSASTSVNHTHSKQK